MKANVRILGHAIHPILVTLPIGLGVGTVAFDLLGHFRPWSDAWPKAAFVVLGGAVVSGLLAGVVGLVDWLGIPKGTRAKRIGLYHAGSNLISLSLLGVSLFLRSSDPRSPDLLAIGLSTAGVLTFALGGWLGGELVERLGMGVDQGANPNAPSSLSHSMPSFAVGQGAIPAVPSPTGAPDFR